MSAAALPAAAPADPARRGALRALVGGAAAVGLLAAGLRPAGAAADRTRTLSLHNTHTLESVRVEYLRGGRHCPDGLARIAHALRDHRSGELHPIDPALLDQLADVAELCGREPEFEVISGYRSPASNAMLQGRSNGGVARRSLHMEGRAIDVRLVGHDLEKLRDAALGMGRGGVGYYRASRFVHLDTGRVRAWTG